jgi:hypothetical protein
MNAHFREEKKNLIDAIAERIMCAGLYGHRP